VGGLMRERNDMLDLLKGIAIYSVVFLHILLPGNVGVAVNCLARFAVPLFFISAGWYSWGTSARVQARRAVRTAGMLLWSCLGLTVFGCILTLRSGGSAEQYVLSRFSWSAAKELLLWQVFPLPYSWPMWFLMALLMLYCLWWLVTALLGKHIPWDLLAVVAVGLLATHLYMGEVRMLLGGTVDSLRIRNVWLDGLPFFLLGGWMHARENWWKAMPAPLLWGAAAAGALLSLFERSRTDFLDLHFGTVLMALSLMAASVRCPGVGSAFLRRTLCFCGRHLTFYIFALHIPLYGIFTEWKGAVPLFAWVMERQWLRPFVIAALCTLMAAALHYLTSRNRRRTHEDH